MSMLLEYLVKNHEHGPCHDYGGKNPKKGYEYFLAKPLPLCGVIGLINRIKDAHRVLIDKSRAYHYKEDEINA